MKNLLTDKWKEMLLMKELKTKLEETFLSVCVCVVRVCVSPVVELNIIIATII